MKLRTFRGNGDGKIFSALSFRDLLLKVFFFVITALTKNYFSLYYSLLDFFGGGVAGLFPHTTPIIFLYFEFTRNNNKKKNEKE